MTPSLRDRLLTQLAKGVRLGGTDGKTTGPGLRAFLTLLINELINELVARAPATALDAKQDKVLTGFVPVTTASVIDPIKPTDTLLAALGKLERKADQAIVGILAYTQRLAPDTDENKVRFDHNAHYARTTVLTEAHFTSLTDATAIAGVTVRLQYFGSVAPAFPANYRLVSGGFIANRETVLYLTFIPAAVTSTPIVAGTPMVEVTISQY